MKLTLIRHGLTRGVLERLYYGSTDLPLLPEGEEELRRLAGEYRYPRADHYYTSGMTRTEQTFACLYGDLPHTALGDLREIDFGDFEMRSYEGDLEHDPAFRQWCQGDYEANVCPNGESSNQVLARSLAALAPVIARGEDAVVVCHGGVIANLLGEWFPTSGNRYQRTPEAGRGYQVDFEGDRPVAFHLIPEPAFNPKEN